MEPASGNFLSKPEISDLESHSVFGAVLRSSANLSRTKYTTYICVKVSSRIAFSSLSTHWILAKLTHTLIARGS